LRKCEGMIIHKALSVARTYGLDYEELISDAYVLFIEAMLKYDEERGKFSTFLWHKLRGLADLHYRENKDIIRVEYREVMHDLSSSVPGIFGSFLKRIELQSCVETELSEDAQEVLGYVLDLPDQRHTVNSLVMRFRRDRGWSVKRAEMTMKEIRDWWRNYGDE